jgi:hypothetical protein
VKRSSRRDYLQKIHARYRRASAPEKERILDEFCANCGYHRKYAIRLLNGPPPGPRGTATARRRRGATYSSRLISVLRSVWEAAGYPWSVRLKALLPEWMPWIRQRFRLTSELEQQLLRISARSIDYRLHADKRRIRRRLYGRTKPGTLLKHHIPIKTDRWETPAPGFTEVDLVSHSGNSASGEFCHSLNLTDVHTTWTETRAVLGKGQEGVRQALEEMRQALPFPLQGIDSDNGSEFINDHLFRYCQAQRIQFTRGRPYKKDDNAHIEQKNWTHVRKLLGYARYDSPAALEAINDLYRNELRLFQNLFLPSVKLEGKLRVGSRLRRRYQAPRTPFQRVCEASATHPERVAELKRQRDRLNPFELARLIQVKLERIFQLSAEAAREPVTLPPPGAAAAGPAPAEPKERGRREPSDDELPADHDGPEPRWRPTC